MTTHTFREGQFPTYRDVVVAATLAELLATVPPTEIADGFVLGSGQRRQWVTGKGWQGGEGEAIYNWPSAGTLGCTVVGTETTFLTYTIPASIALDWWTSKKCIVEDFMLGINFAAAADRLTLRSYIGIGAYVDGTTQLVQQTQINPQITGAPTFAAGQNRCLDMLCKLRPQGGTGISAVKPRSHAKWDTSFIGTTRFGTADEYLWGQSTFDFSQDLTVTWRYLWTSAGAPTLYMDHLHVAF